MIRISSRLIQYALRLVGAWAALTTTLTALAQENTAIGYAVYRADGVYLYTSLSSLPASLPVQLVTRYGEDGEAHCCQRIDHPDLVPVAAAWSVFFLNTGDPTQGIFIDGNLGSEIYQYRLGNYRPDHSPENTPRTSQDITPQFSTYEPEGLTRRWLDVVPAFITAEHVALRRDNPDGDIALYYQIGTAQQAYQCVSAEGEHLFLGRPGQIKSHIYWGLGSEIDEESFTCNQAWFPITD